MTRGQILLAAAAECVLLMLVAMQWWQVRADRRDLLARARPAGAAGDGRRLRRELDRLARRTAPGRRLGDRLDRARLPLTVGEAVLVTALATGLVYWLVLLTLNQVFAVAAAVLTPLGGLRMTTLFIRRRAAAMVDQLPALTAALAGATAAGLSLSSALQLAADDLPDPVAEEIRAALQSMSVGFGTEAALRETARRLPSRELDLLVTTLTIQARSGGNLVRALRRLTDTLENRRDSRREAQSMTAGSTSTAYLMIIFGFVIVAVLQRAFPGSLDRAMGSTLGAVAIGGACGLFALGVVLVRRTTRVPL
ncbi:MAG: hypothetical protein AVDCRST_MAG41-2800 [uncultured Corynebacteriales bacterium]|uniref:Type II secretion system protein GspF domain-containing protein n=1 Tax=uncultured Mycobacteriales bacterium TaxID=581187 RepID=A0A6J4J8M8_9ACTN|nr:MAG: hypothetical protein AVDCRST_MAG41-2800 [uncultured Corynebacteriales bacterium]